MKFILTLSNWIKDWDMVKKLAFITDENKFWGIALPDHYLWTPGRDHTVDSWVALSYLASKTQNVHLGTLVSPLALRPPAILAKMVSTVDFLSNGRTFLGVGAGWSQREFETYSEWNEPAIRVNKTAEGFKLIKTMWTEETINFEGKYYHVKDGILEPKPIQKPHPPFLFGGFGPRMLKLGGKYADIVFIPPWRYENYDDGKNIVTESAKKNNRPIPFLASASPADKDRHYAPVDFTIETYFKSVNQAKTNGCEYFILSLPEESIINNLNQFTNEIMPSFT